MRMKCRTGVAAVALLIAPPTRVVGQDATLVQQVLAGHNAARQSIRTLSASLRVEQLKPEHRLLAAGTYWRIGDEVRVHQQGLEGSTIDYRVAGGEVRQVTLPGRAGTTPPGLAQRLTEQDFTTRTNLFAEMQLVLADADGKPRDLGALLADASAGVTAGRERLGDDECVTLSFSVASRRGPLTRFKLWHVPSKNYLIRRVEAVPEQAPDITFVSEITAWFEAAGGVIVPTTAKSESFHKGKLVHSRLSSVTDLRVNEPIDRAVMALPKLPAGSVLRDDIARVTGKVDSNWRPIGPLEPTRPMMAPPQPAASASEGYTSQSSSEPVSVGFVILVASGSLLVIALAVYGYRRYRLAGG
jgi:hypothetical protein